MECKQRKLIKVFLDVNRRLRTTKLDEYYAVLKLKKNIIF